MPRAFPETAHHFTLALFFLRYEPGWLLWCNAVGQRVFFHLGKMATLNSRKPDTP